MVFSNNNFAFKTSVCFDTLQRRIKKNYHFNFHNNKIQDVGC